MGRVFACLGLSAALVACGTGDASELFGESAGAGASGAASQGGGPGAGAGDPGSGAGGPGSSTGPDVGGATSSSTTAAGGAGASGGSSGEGGSPSNPFGCSDGTREYFQDVAAQPNIAGCDGGFDVPGVTTPDSMAPACNRMAGNDGANPNGGGCSVEDLCAEGWYVCHGAEDVGAHSATQECELPTSAEPRFYVTRQVQDEQGACATSPWTNNITGCGSMGGFVPATCAPLQVRMRYSECIPTMNWYCGSNLSDNLIEAEIVFKVGSGEGGVLCCRKN